MAQPRFILVTGSGRCGTGYMAAALSAASGVIIGHEKVFTNLGLREDLRKRYAGDASWLAVPCLLDKGPGFHPYVVHLVRHPMEVIKSLRGIDFFKAPNVHGEYYQWARRFTPGISAIPQDQMEAWFYFTWNSMIEKYADIRLRVEDVRALDISKILADARVYTQGTHNDVIQAVKKISTRINHKVRDESMTLNGIDEPYRSLIQGMGRRYGYDL